MNETELLRRFVDIVLADRIARAALDALRDADLPQGRLVSGVLYNAVWNRLTGRPAGHGVKDVDVAYFDAADLSYEAEDAVIRRATPLFARVGAPVEIRNQARVHLWFPERFGLPYAPLSSSDDGLARYATRCHAVSAHWNQAGALEIAAPFGLEDVFSMTLVPNRALDNRQAHAEKAARAKARWPEVTVIDW